jgi:hypothetical protein
MTKENADGKEEGVLIYYHNFSDFTADNDEWRLPDTTANLRQARDRFFLLDIYSLDLLININAHSRDTRDNSVNSKWCVTALTKHALTFGEPIYNWLIWLSASAAVSQVPSSGRMC